MYGEKQCYFAFLEDKCIDKNTSFVYICNSFIFLTKQDKWIYVYFRDTK